jgi:hypothetical protein
MSSKDGGGTCFAIPLRVWSVDLRQLCQPKENFMSANNPGQQGQNDQNQQAQNQSGAGQQGQTQQPGRRPGQHSGQLGQQDQGSPGGSKRQDRKETNPSQRQDDDIDDDGIARRTGSDNGS